jgi:UDP-GlcNAc:undecaprenyl-phosphate/decaprenyl-phosphate GlcNAc-1-phosphate transferase
LIKPFKLIQIPPLLLIGILLVPNVKKAVVTESLMWAYILLLSFGLACALVPTIMWLAEKLGAVDKPGGRKTHQHVTPLMGGSAIFLGFALVLFLAQDILYFTQQHKGVALGATLIFIVGLLDDVWGLTAKIRLLAQVLAVGILIKFGATLSFLPETWWGHLGEYIITFLWVIGITNAINFLDGMDGLASGTTAINAIFFSLVALRADGSEMLLLAIALAGSCLGFLPFNFRRHKPASIFLGDSGSNFLGFTLAGIGILGEWGNDGWVGLVVPIVILGVPIFDTSLTTVVRIATGQVHNFGQWLHFTGRDHFHHRLSDLGLGNKRAVWVIYLISAIQGLEALVLKNARGVDALFSISQVCLAYLLMGGFMVFVHNRYVRLLEIRRNAPSAPEQ